MFLADPIQGKGFWWGRLAEDGELGRQSSHAAEWRSGMRRPARAAAQRNEHERQPSRAAERGTMTGSCGDAEQRGELVRWPAHAAKCVGLGAAIKAGRSRIALTLGKMAQGLKEQVGQRVP